MNLTPEQIEDLKAAAQPLMSWLQFNCHPHVTCLVTSESTEIVEALAMVRTGNGRKAPAASKETKPPCTCASGDESANHADSCAVTRWAMRTFACPTTEERLRGERDELRLCASGLLALAIAWRAHWQQNYGQGKTSPIHDELIERAQRIENALASVGTGESLSGAQVSDSRVTVPSLEDVCQKAAYELWNNNWLDKESIRDAGELIFAMLEQSELVSTDLATARQALETERAAVASLRGELAEANAKLDTICSDVNYVGGVQYWQGKAHDAVTEAVKAGTLVMQACGQLTDLRANYASLLTCAQGLAEAAKEAWSGLLTHANEATAFTQQRISAALSAFESATKKETEPKQ